MLKIGEFSRLCQVTVKALHHYEDLGLLHPAHIDLFTGYRYYTVEQLPRFHRILALKELGLSLEQIGLMLDEDVSTEQIRGMLRLKQAEIQQHVREEQQRLAMVEFRLHMMEAEDHFPELDVVIKRLEPVRVLLLPIKRPDLEVVGKEILRAIAAKNINIKPMGGNMVVMRRDEMADEIKPLDAQLEVLLAVDDDQPGDLNVEGVGVFVLRDEPAIETAATLMLHGGDANERFEKIALLQRWAVVHGHKLCNMLRIVIHRGPPFTLDRSEWVTELQLAVEPA
jgi:DNA-binding transcriptional MerR regulator